MSKATKFATWKHDVDWPQVAIVHAIGAHLQRVDTLPPQLAGLAICHRPPAACHAGVARNVLRHRLAGQVQLRTYAAVLHIKDDGGDDLRQWFIVGGARATQPISRRGARIQLLHQSSSIATTTQKRNAHSEYCIYVRWSCDGKPKSETIMVDVHAASVADTRIHYVNRCSQICTEITRHTAVTRRNAW
jgi:hypothetical protein